MITNLSVYAEQHASRWLGESPRVFLLPDRLRHNVTWGGFSIVNATIEGMRFFIQGGDV